MDKGRAKKRRHANCDRSGQDATRTASRDRCRVAAIEAHQCETMATTVAAATTATTCGDSRRRPPLRRPIRRCETARDRRHALLAVGVVARSYTSSHLDNYCARAHRGWLATFRRLKRKQAASVFAPNVDRGRFYNRCSSGGDNCGCRRHDFFRPSLRSERAHVATIVRAVPTAKCDTKRRRPYART